MNEIVDSFQIAISAGYDGYPSESPYSPSRAYPEYPFGPAAITAEVNQAYEGVRFALQLLGLDTEHHGQKEWNPLGQIICPGDMVVLKPNFVSHFCESQSGNEDCLITHSSIIRAALDYVYIALKGKGRIIIADAPISDADFDGIRRIAGLDKIQEFYHRHAGFEVEVYDLRPEKARTVDGVFIRYDKLPGDPAGYTKVDLGQKSAFYEISHLCHLMYGADCDTNELKLHHHDDIHEYLISKTILEADCIINLPKLKTHKKSGITGSMKNLVGINGNKNWLPHHRMGTPVQGGDQFADDQVIHRIERKAMACFWVIFPLLGPIRKTVIKPLKALGKGIFGDTKTQTIRSGNWHGNDTTWRMVIDLNRIFMYAKSGGWLNNSPVRRVFQIVDGIIGGEGDGPLDPSPKKAGIVMAGMNPVAIDLACARIMGFDYTRLPFLYRALANNSMPICRFGYDDVICESNDPQFKGNLAKFDGIGLAFKPPMGWKGYVEVDDEQASTIVTSPHIE